MRNPEAGTLEAKVLLRLAANEGRAFHEVAAQVNLPSATPAAVVKAVIGSPDVEELEGKGFRIHTVWVRDVDLFPFEPISFPALSLKEFAAEPWDDSELRRHIDRLLLVPLCGPSRETDTDERRFGRPAFWVPDREELEAIRIEWARYQQDVLAGRAAYQPVLDQAGKPQVDSTGRQMRANQLPGMTETRFIHMRPKAQDATDTEEDPLGNQVTRQAFWLNKGISQELLAAAAAAPLPAAGAIVAEKAPESRGPAVDRGAIRKLRFGTLAGLLRAMRRESKTSVITTGSLPPLNQALYIRDWVDEEIDRFLRGGFARLLVLTGSAGHGKSAAIAVATEAAKKAGIQAEVRPDASHGDRPNEDFRAGLRRFLDRAQAAPAGHKFVLGINLGKALDFFSDTQDAARYASLAAAFDEEFKLGISGSPAPNPDFVIVDISHRIQPKLTERGLDLPWVRSFLDKLDPLSPQSVVRDAFEFQRTLPLGPHDPLVANLRLLSLPSVREHLVKALASAIVRHEVHLTPRRVMDFLSRILLPSQLETFLDDEGTWTEAGLKEIGDPQKWGHRLNASLFSQLFPDIPEESAFDPGLAVALRRENPTYDRSSFMDKRILRWSADPQSLGQEIPTWFLEYLGWKGERIGDDGRRLLIQAAAWTPEGSPASRRVRRVEDFLALCEGRADSQSEFSERLKGGLRHYVTRSFHREWDPDARPQSIAVQVYRFSFNSRLTTQLGDFMFSFLDVPKRRWPATEFGIEVQRSPGPPISLSVDWSTFDLLMDVHAGVNPASAESGSTITLNRLQRALQGASDLAHNLEWRDEQLPGKLTMRREGTLQKTKVHGEVRE